MGNLSISVATKFAYWTRSMDQEKNTVQEGERGKYESYFQPKRVLILVTRYKTAWD